MQLQSKLDLAALGLLSSQQCKPIIAECYSVLIIKVRCIWFLLNVYY